ncbi:BglG family transcription antiterminator [Liquorilactobacillus mali]|uniref:Sorbitol operon transcription regulator n=1 Tax=Liquorilactobacillus mali KCTC 3596 = DSM 20444 TaxID=1046596 RepID=J0L3H2_9LACO|nr:HTH domain-containing protein [Liquorilactobacillus mali]EJE97565.1 sorbitol operon transcription antiterminator,BglG family protein [Liquorilactobacillus mali KCTC 3596 = DSM 20444]KRN08851.1 sorbitol operon transcription regulator [Liquorilactobacillus mali KCTC 3596 = DSM 20444]MDC7952968.1 HTH domain-containing protein [Liquorilactobacillus mali]QFQ73972.1 HTH domain-containing protein [Liquorilactobacillus mali]
MDRQNFEMLNLFINNDSLTLKELQLHFNVSRGTITKNIRAINEYLEGIAEIKVNQSRFYLVIDNYGAIAKLQTTFLKRDLDFNDPLKRQAAVLKHLLKHSTEYVILDDLAESLSVSRGTINNDIKTLRKRLEKYGAKIETKTNRGIRLVVKYDYVYAIVTRNIVGKYYDFELSLDNSADSRMMELIKETETNHSFVAMVKRNISIINWLKNYGIRIKDDIPHYHPLLAKSTTKGLRREIDNSMSSPLSNSEWEFISYPFSIKKNTNSDDGLIKSALENVTALMNIIFPAIKKKLDIELNFDRLLVELRYHLLFLINRSIFDVSTEEFISADMVNKYPVSSELAQLTISSLEKQLDINISDQELGYLTLYFQMALEEYMAYSASYQVALVEPISNSMKKFITEQLKELLDDDVQVDVLSSVDELEKSSKKYLLIFSNKYFSIHHGIQQAPIIRLNTVFNRGILRERLQISLVDEAVNRGICNFDVTRFSGKETYMESVGKLIEQEIVRGQLTEEFMQDWIRREKKSSSIFGDGVALPHVIDKSGINRILIKVGLFENAVVFDNQKIKIVFLVAIPYKLNADLSKVLAQVYDLIRSITTNKNIYSNLMKYDNTRGIVQLMEAI